MRGTLIIAVLVFCSSTLCAQEISTKTLAGTWLSQPDSSGGTMTYVFAEDNKFDLKIAFFGTSMDVNGSYSVSINHGITLLRIVSKQSPIIQEVMIKMDTSLKKMKMQIIEDDKIEWTEGKNTSFSFSRVNDK
jgi:hypothetical protein